jgi:CHAT domain
MALQSNMQATADGPTGSMSGAGETVRCRNAPLTRSRWSAVFSRGWTHRVRDIALVVGNMKQDSTVEHQAFDPTAPARYTIFNTRRGLIDDVFKTNRFNLMHYFGHCGRGEEKGPEMGRYLSLAEDKRTLRLQDIGAIDAEREFFSRNPVIVLNCCDGVQSSALLGGPESFPHCFIDNACIACVGSIWPVDSRAGNRFMTSLYAHLASGEFFHNAVKSARHELLDRARSTDEPKEKLALTLAARAYVYYGPPDLRCTFVGRDS